MDLLRGWRALRKHWLTALATTVIVVVTTVFYTLGQTKIYQATSTIQLDPNPPRPLGRGVDTVVDMGTGDYWNNREYYETQYQIIRSMRVALATVRALDLDHDPAFLRQAPEGSRLPPRSVEPEVAAQLLRQQLSVEPVKDSRLAMVHFEDADATRAQRILSTLVDTYVEQNLDAALSSTNAAVDWLRSQLDKLKTDLESSEMALHEFKSSKNMLSVAFDDQSNMLREEMKQLNDALTAVRTKREEVAARRKELLKVHAEDPTNLPATELLQSAILQQLRQRYEDAVRDRASLEGAGKGPGHPEVAAADARVDASRTAILDEVRNIQRAVDRDLAVIVHQQAGLEGLFEKAKRQALDLNLLEIEYNRLQRSKVNNEKLYEIVLERTKESDLTRMLRVNNIHIVDRPLLPRTPIKPHVMANLAAGGVVGLLFGLGAALGRSLLDRTLKTPADVEQELGMPFLGLLPEIEDTSPIRTKIGRRRNRGSGPPTDRELIVHDQPWSGIAEASRAIRTNLMFMAPDHPYRTLLVTSAGPSEGKTTVACCIATAMAQTGQRVVLLDCDLRRPRIHRVFKLDAQSGVTTALLEAAHAPDLVAESRVPNLYVLSAGPIPPNPAEIFHSARFRALISSLQASFDRVIIDSPPLAAVTDAAILSTLADGVVLVVKAFTTRSDLSKQAIRALTDVGARISGVVLNAVDLDRHEYKYYHYYYKRGDYYSTATPSIAGAPPPPSAAS